MLFSEAGGGRKKLNCYRIKQDVMRDNRIFCRIVEEDDAILGIPYICVPSSRNDFFLSLKRYTTPAEGPSVD